MLRVTIEICDLVLGVSSTLTAPFVLCSWLVLYVSEVLVLVSLVTFAWRGSGEESFGLFSSGF